MKRYSLSGLADHVLRRDILSSHTSECAGLALQLARLAEFDSRRLYAHEEFDSTYAWCIGRLNYSEQAAYKRIRVGRVGRKFPAVLEAIACGDVSLSAALVLAPHLTARNVDELLSAAARKTRDQVEKLIAARFPKSDLPTVVHLIEPAPTLAPAVLTQPVPAPGGSVGSVATDALEASAGIPPAADASCQLSPGTVAPVEVSVSVVPMAPESRPPRVMFLSSTSVAYQFTVSQTAHEKLEYAKVLLGHAVPSGSLPEIFERALDALVEKLEKSKFGKRSRTQPASRGRKTSRQLEPDQRYVPDRVKNAVWERDGGQCTFVGTSGRRCEARTRLEFDHVTPVGRGGLSTKDNLRLRCRAHNQLEAERTYGGAFMNGKRESAREQSNRGRPGGP